MEEDNDLNFGSNIDLKEEEKCEKTKNIVLFTIFMFKHLVMYHELDASTFIDLFEFLDTPFFQENVLYNVEFNYTTLGEFIPKPQIFIGSYIRQIYHNDIVIFRDEEGISLYVKVRDGNYFVPIYYKK